jgi:AraC family transcriptional activator of pobA
MKHSLPIPYVPIAPDYPEKEEPPLLFTRFAGFTFVNPPSDPPHRHTFQELILVEAGLLRHSVDGQPFDLSPHTLALISRGQVHTVDRGVEVTGWLLRFADDYLPVSGDGRLWPDFTTTFGGPNTPPMLALRLADVEELNAVADLIEVEWESETLPFGNAVLRHLLAVLLFRIARIMESAAGTDPAAGEEQRVYRDFTALLERDFTTHHDVAHYAAELGLDPDRLSAILTWLLGKSTKRVIDERLMLEARRALRYSDHSLAQIATALGYADQFHLSKTFKRIVGVSPSTFRQ